MRSLVRSASLAIVIAASSAILWSQTARPLQSPYLAPADNLVALRSSRMFDARAGTILNNQIILIRGDRIADVGPSVQIPPEARVIDLGGATVLPGMIDAHVHNAGRGDSLEMKTIVMVQSASRDLEAGFTTTVDMDSRGGFGTVDLRNAIAAGLNRQVNPLAKVVVIVDGRHDVRMKVARKRRRELDSFHSSRSRCSQ